MSTLPVVAATATTSAAAAAVSAAPPSNSSAHPSPILHSTKSPTPTPHLTPGTTSPGLVTKMSPLLTPQIIERRISFPSLGAVAPMMPASPNTASRSLIPSIRDLRSPAYTSRICGMDSALVHALRGAVSGHVHVTAEGKVEAHSSRAVTPTPLSPRTSITTGSHIAPGLASLERGQLERRQSHSSTSVSSSGSTPSTPRQHGTTGGGIVIHANVMSGEQHINRTQACHQLLLNLISYLPPLPASLMTSTHADGSTTTKRVYVGLSIGPSAGKVLFEERLPWPVAAAPAPAPAPVPSSSSPSTTSSPPATTATAAATASPPQSHHLDTSGLSRSRSQSALTDDGIGAAWPDDSVALSVFLLLDTLDIDSKQITFVSSGCRGVDVAALFAALYKRDLSVPNQQANGAPLMVVATGGAGGGTHSPLTHTTTTQQQSSRAASTTTTAAAAPPRT